MNKYFLLTLLSISTFSHAIEIDAQLKSALMSFKERTRYQVSGVSRTPTPGLFVLMTDNGVQLTNQEGKLLYSRDIAYYADKKGEITGDALNEIRLEALSEIDPNSIIVVKSKNEKRKIIISTAIDCPYCLQQEEILAETNVDATLYLVPSVLDRSNWPILEKIMCSEDRAVSWKNYMLNKKVPDNTGKCFWSENYSYIGTTAYTSQILKTVGTPQMVYANGSVQSFTSSYPLGHDVEITNGNADIFNPITIITSYFSTETYVPPKKSLFGF